VLEVLLRELPVIVVACGGWLTLMLSLPSGLLQPIDMDAELTKLEEKYGKGNISEADLMSHIMYPQVRCPASLSYPSCTNRALAMHSPGTRQALTT
jgi:hypothetical protein